MTRQTGRAREPSQDSAAGVAVDAHGGPVVDPTQNVLDLVNAAIQRQDDLRQLDSAHIREVVTLRAEYEAKLRAAETGRIDAIRAVDIGAVNRASEVAAAAAASLAAVVAASAEALRTQVSAAATASNVALAAEIDPLKKDIADLRRAQYEAQGVKAQTGETRLNTGAILGGISVLLVLVFGIASLWVASN